MKCKSSQIVTRHPVAGGRQEASSAPAGNVWAMASLDAPRAGTSRPRETDSHPKRAGGPAAARYPNGRPGGATKADTRPKHRRQSTETGLRPGMTRRRAPRPVATLAIDIGGTGIKASVLDETGHMEHDRVRIPTPYPLSPQKLVTVLVDLIKPLPPFDRVSAGFPGMVRGGHILSAPHFVSPDGPGGTPVPKLVAAWESLRSRVGAGPSDRQAHQGRQRRRHPGGGGGRGQGLRAGPDAWDRGRHRLLPRRAPAAPLRVRPHAVPQGGHLQRGARRGAPAAASATRSGRSGCSRPSRRSTGPDVLRPVLHRRRQLATGSRSTCPTNVTLVDNDAGILGGIKLWERTVSREPVWGSSPGADTARRLLGDGRLQLRPSSPIRTKVSCAPSGSSPQRLSMPGPGLFEARSVQALAAGHHQRLQGPARRRAGGPGRGHDLLGPVRQPATPTCARRRSLCRATAWRRTGRRSRPACRSAQRSAHPSPVTTPVPTP